MSDDLEFESRLDAINESKTLRLKAFLIELGRPDLAAEYDAKMNDIRLGIDGARSTWGALSKAQRAVMELLEAGYHLLRRPSPSQRWDANGFANRSVPNVCGSPTVGNLMARDLACWAAGRSIVITERGRFVIAHGKT